MAASRDLETITKVYKSDSARRRGGQQYDPSTRRLHVAYLSYDLREHPIGWMVEGLFQSHNRSAVMISAYHYGAVSPELLEAIAANATLSQPFADLTRAYGGVTSRACTVPVFGPSGGGTACDDALRRIPQSVRLARASDHYYWILSVPDEAVVDHMVASSVDIVVDLMAHTTGSWVSCPS